MEKTKSISEIIGLAKEARPVEIMKIKSKRIVECERGYSPIQLNISNTTNEIKRVSVFEIFDKNPDGVTLTPSQSGFNIEFMKKYFHENPHLSSLIRLQSSDLMGLQFEQVISKVWRDSMGNVESTPAIIPIDLFSKHQFQSGILDVVYPFVLDGVSNDLEFDLMPNTTLTFTMFFSHKCKSRTRKSLKELNEFCKSELKKNITEYLTSIVVENKSDVSKEIILFDEYKYNTEYSLDSDLVMGSILSNSIGYKSNLNLYRIEKFNSIRIFSSSQDNLKQISKKIEFNSGNTYYPSIDVNANQFQSKIGDISIVGEELSNSNTMKVTVLPKTRVVYLFKNVKNLSPSTTNTPFINIDIENISDVPYNKYDILGVNNDNKDFYHSIGKNKMAFKSDADLIGFDYMRIRFYNSNQIEKPIIFKVKGEEYTIYPVIYFNENDFQPNFVEVPFPFKGDFCLNDLEILADLINKGDGMNVTFLKTVSPYTSPIIEAYPIWIENSNTTCVLVNLVNNISNFNGFPDGVKCYIEDNISYQDLLNKFDGALSVDLLRIFSRNTGQIHLPIGIIDETNPESLSTTHINTQEYLSANQFQTGSVSILHKLFDLTKVMLDGSEIQKVDSNNNLLPIPPVEQTKNRNQKVQYDILGNTKVCLLVHINKSVNFSKSVSKTKNIDTWDLG